MAIFSKLLMGAALICALGSAGAMAQELPVDGRTARDLLFSRKGGQVVVFEQDFLNETQIAQFETMGGVIPYYGAVAMAPNEGMLSEANQAAANHHSIEAAEAAALKACNTARSGGRACVVVMHFLPDDYEAGRALELSQAATEAFRSYRRGRGEKAFVISPSTGLYAIEKGDGASGGAIDTCNVDFESSNNTATDCYTVIAD